MKVYNNLYDKLQIELNKVDFYLEKNGPSVVDFCSQKNDSVYAYMNINTIGFTKDSVKNYFNEDKKLWTLEKIIKIRVYKDGVTQKEINKIHHIIDEYNILYSAVMRVVDRKTRIKKILKDI